MGQPCRNRRATRNENVGIRCQSTADRRAREAVLATYIGWRRPGLLVPGRHPLGVKAVALPPARQRLELCRHDHLQRHHFGHRASYPLDLVEHVESQVARQARAPAVEFALTAAPASFCLKPSAAQCWDFVPRSRQLKTTPAPACTHSPAGNDSRPRAFPLGRGLS